QGFLSSRFLCLDFVLPLVLGVHLFVLHDCCLGVTAEFVMESDFQALSIREKEELGDQSLSLFGREILGADLKKIMNGGPWSFNNCILLVHQLAKSLAKNLGNVLGSFLDYDTEVNRNRLNSYMRIRVRLDIRQPLLRWKKIRKQGKGCLDASFNHERIPTICYLCDLIGYSESNCRKLIDIGEGEVVRAWLETIRAEVRQAQKQRALPWRREGQLFSRANRMATS
ncbi:hypothetical protein Goshw_011811, partial [Gossypium schwendimanii]|nr:hypothetical protein [Gossypium schwendimanii]